MEHDGLPEDFYETQTPRASNTKAWTAGILATGALVGSLLLGCPILDRNARQNAIDGFYNTANESRATYFNGNHDSATRNHQVMWDEINRYQRNALKDPFGRLTDKEMNHLETNLHSTNVFSNGPLVKPVVK